jgi:hypothetical protein
LGRQHHVSIRESVGLKFRQLLTLQRRTQMSRGVLRVAAAGLTCVVGHSAFIAHRQSSLIRDVVESRERQKQILLSLPADFRPGSTEDMVLDSVQSGDLLVFSRRWYLHHLPMAISLFLYRRLFDCDFDHVAVILVDRFGKPFVIENTPYQGIQCRPLSERLLFASSSENILLLPILPRDRANEGRELLNDRPTQLQLASHNELWSIANSVAAKILQSVFHTPSRQCDCNVLFVQETLRQVGIDLSTATNEPLTVQDLTDGQVRMNLLKTNQKLQFDPESVLMRTS